MEEKVNDRYIGTLYLTNGERVKLDTDLSDKVMNKILDGSFDSTHVISSFKGNAFGVDVVTIPMTSVVKINWKKVVE